MMLDQLESVISAIERRVNAKDPDAFADAERLAEQHPDEPKVWSLLSYVRERNKDYEGAIAAMNRLMQLLPPSAGMYCRRGMHEFDRGNLLAALSDFTEGIAKCEEQNDTYYRSPLYFRRADVLIALGRKAEARADLQHVPNHHTAWTTTLRTKAEMLAECDR